MPAARALPRRARVLVVDVGGSHVKAYLSDAPGRRIKFRSGPSLTPRDLVDGLRRALPSDRFDLVAVGYPGLVRRNRIVGEPPHLGTGWKGFDLATALGRPVRVVNDAAMQALGSYRGGSMLFLGLGTGLGSAMVVDGQLLPMELGHLPYKKGKPYEGFTGEEARRRLGGKRWRAEVFRVMEALTAALEPEYVVLGGGNARRIPRLPRGVVRGNNRHAFYGGVRLWRGLPASLRPAPEERPAPPRPRRPDRSPR